MTAIFAICESSDVPGRYGMAILLCPPIMDAAKVMTIAPVNNKASAIMMRLIRLLFREHRNPKNTRAATDRSTSPK